MDEIITRFSGAQEGCTLLVYLFLSIKGILKGKGAVVVTYGGLVVSDILYFRIFSLLKPAKQFPSV